MVFFSVDSVLVSALSAGAVVESVLVVPAHAAIRKTMHSASINARTFFICFSS